MCDCLQLTIHGGGFPEETFQANASGTYNGYNYWEYVYNGLNIVIWWEAGRWVSSSLLGSFGVLYATAVGSVLCPEGSMDGSFGSLIWLDAGGVSPLTVHTTMSCDFNCGNQDRTFKRYDSIKLPEIFQEQNRGLKDCCCKYKVLGDDTGDTFKNDTTSAWIKISERWPTFSKTK